MKKRGFVALRAVMNLRPDLKLDWCSFKAAQYACLNFHYARRMPAGKLLKIGVWEAGKFKGCVIFGRGNNNNMGKPFGLIQTEMCELVRIALKDCAAPVSRVVSIALKMLRRHCPGLRLIVSYADPAQGHHGGIYQAMGWVYGGGNISPQRELIVDGKWMHKRSANSKWGTASPERIFAMTGLTAEYGPIEKKHVYYLPLDGNLKGMIEKMRKPYPKRAESITADAIAIHAVEGGAAPTSALSRNAGKQKCRKE